MMTMPSDKVFVSQIVCQRYNMAKCLPHRDVMAGTSCHSGTKTLRHRAVVVREQRQRDKGRRHSTVSADFKGGIDSVHPLPRVSVVWTPLVGAFCPDSARVKSI